MNGESIALSSTLAKPEEDDGYRELESAIRDRIAALKPPIFTTNAAGLFETYLEAIPEPQRQHYRCHACRGFLEWYGGLVTIDPSGDTKSVFWTWSDLSSPFGIHVARTLAREVEKARVTGVFVADWPAWGRAVTGKWTHLSGTCRPELLARNPKIKTGSQEMAERREDFVMLKRALADYSRDAAAQAVRILKADALDRSEKTLGVAEWFLSLHDTLGSTRGPARDNLIWRAVATAPAGFCHVRSTMINTLLDDLIAGLPIETIQARWAAKMHPLQYQRPTTLKDGTIEQAERLVQSMGIERSLSRRAAKLEEVVAFWTPRPVEKPARSGGGVFDHLRQSRQGVDPVELPAVTMTWEKFARTALPNALSIEVLLSQHPQPFFGFVTAADPDAPPVLQWDGLNGQRNPVSWYFYHGGSMPGHWGLAAGWANVRAICRHPCHWQDAEKFGHYTEGAFFILEGAKDSRAPEAGFFPEMLKSEYHGIRAVLEAHARRTTVAGHADGTANGIALQKGSNQPAIRLRVTATDGASQYVIDRWD